MPVADVERRRPHHFASCGVCYFEEEHAHRAAQPVAVVESVCGTAIRSARPGLVPHPAVSHLRVFVCGASASCVAVAERSAGCRCCGDPVVSEGDYASALHSERCFVHIGGRVRHAVDGHACHGDVAGGGCSSCRAACGCRRASCSRCRGWSVGCSLSCGRCGCWSRCGRVGRRVEVVPEADVERRRPHDFASRRVRYLYEMHAHRLARALMV